MQGLLTAPGQGGKKESGVVWRAADESTDALQVSAKWRAKRGTVYVRAGWKRISPSAPSTVQSRGHFLDRRTGRPRPF